jgi:hypothetical protein
MIKWLIRTLFRAVGQCRIQSWALHHSNPGPTKPVSGSSVESYGECRHLGPRTGWSYTGVGVALLQQSTSRSAAVGGVGMLKGRKLET